MSGSIFKWDGSDVTELVKESLIEEGSYEKNTYWKLTHKDILEYCIVRQSGTTIPCLIDELKPIFNMHKIGTHWIRYRGKKLILLRLIVKDEIIIQDITLDKIKFRQSLSHEVQKIFVFRELLGLSRSWESSIILRERNHFMRPMSFYEPNMTPASEEKVIPNTVLEKWFKNTSLDDVVKKLLKVEKLEDIPKTIHNLRTKMETVVNRVNKDEITHIDEILKRINNRLQFVL